MKILVDSQIWQKRQESVDLPTPFHPTPKKRENMTISVSRINILASIKKE